MKTGTHREKRAHRRRRVRSRVKGTGIRPRLSVFRSNRYVWVQLINDETGHTLAAFGTRDLSGPRTATAATIGEKIAGEAREKKISAAVFDRGGYRYHGIVKAVAEGARAGGLKF